jgi:hypothetical protein
VRPVRPAALAQNAGDGIGATPGRETHHQLGGLGGWRMRQRQSGAQPDQGGQSGAAKNELTA